jgi:hypothetical protein
MLEVTGPRDTFDFPVLIGRGNARRRPISEPDMESKYPIIAAPDFKLCSGRYV